MIDSMHGLFVQGLQAVYDAEQQEIEVAPKLAQSISSPELKAAAQKRLDGAQTRIPRLEAALKAAGAPIDRVPNAIMQGLLSVGEKIRDQTSDPQVRDAGIVAGAQLALHYYIAAYGTLAGHAKHLGINEAAELASTTVQECKDANEEMTQLAEQIINPKAANA